MARIRYIRVNTLESGAVHPELTEIDNYDRVYIEKSNGKSADRPELKAMLEHIHEGDVVEVGSYSAIARSTQDLLSILARLNEKGVDFVSEKEKVDTSTPSGRLALGIFADLVQFERECMLERQADGIAIAKQEGRAELTHE